MHKPKIPLSKPYLGRAEIQAVTAALEADAAAVGAQVEAFEREFAAWVGTEYALATDSGTSALLVALLAQGIEAGDEVITTPFTAVATLNAVFATGATPVFVDIEAQTYNLDVEQVEAAITARTKALLPVHLYGHLCEIDRLVSLADQHDLFLLEDAGQAMGAAYGDKLAGSFGTGAFSLSTTATITSLEGGVITTDDAAFAERCRTIRAHGLDADGNMVALGLQFGLSDLHAALARAQMDRLDGLIHTRRQHAAFLNSKIQSAGIPLERDGYQHAWSRYTLCLPEDCDRETIIRQLARAGIETGVFYSRPVYANPVVREKVGELYLPVVEEMAKRVLSLPVHPQLDPEELEFIATEVNKTL